MKAFSAAQDRSEKRYHGDILFLLRSSSLLFNNKKSPFISHLTYRINYCMAIWWTFTL